MKCIIYFLLLMISLNANAWDMADLKDESLSPFTTSARNVLYVGGALTLGVLLFEDSIVDPTQKEFVDDKPLGSLSKFGDLAGQMIPNALYSIGMALDGLSGNKLGYSRAIGMIKASAYSGAVTNILKVTVREPRPNSNARTSFPSGHATVAFAFSGYVYEEHGWVWGVPAFALSSFVGASRINDNRHFLHDVLAGSTIGLAYGIGISKVDKMKRDAGEKEAGLTIVPLYDGDIKGLALLTEF